MARRRFVKVDVEFPNGDKRTWKAEADSIEQHYRQLNFLSEDGTAIALNLVETRFVRVVDEAFDFNEKNFSNSD